MFPVDPDAIGADAAGLFICQDPALRSRILPLFRFDPGAAADRPLGQGTTFRIDPWFGCLTAFHVVEDLFEVKDEAALTLKDGLRLAALQIDGLGFGRFAMPENAWRPLSGAFSIFGIERPPLAAPRIRNATELIALRIQPANPDEPAPYLPVDLRRWQPRLGEIVLGLGFAGLDRDQADEGGDRPIEQYLQGAFGRITEIVPAVGERGRPWPMIRVDTDWPGGTSGGPVFNEAGHVIGVISAGISGHAMASATFFAGWDLPERICASIDPDNPGWFRCFGAFDTTGVLLRYGTDREAIAGTVQAASVSPVSVNPVTGSYVRTEGGSG